MDERLRIFLDRVDAALVPFVKEGERFDIYHLGRSALMMHYDFPLATSDVDFVGMQNDSELEKKAVELFGKDTPLALAAGFYLDPVAPEIPPLPGRFRERCEAVAGPWKVLRLWKLEANDLAATKLKSFRPHDRADLQALCDRGLIDAGKLRAALESAFPFRSPKAGDEEDDPDNPDWTKAVASYKRVVSYVNGEITSI